MTMGLSLFLLFSLLTVISIFSLRKNFINNPLFFYFIFNWIMGAGCFRLFDFYDSADVTHAMIFVISPILFLLGYVIAISNINMRALYVNFWGKNVEFLSKNNNKKILLLFILTILISLLYYRLLGYNLILLTMTSGVDDFTTMRLGSYSGEVYYAPGVFNQFKNTLFPILFIYFYYINRKKKWNILYVFSIGILLLYCLLGTGQRTFLITSAVITFFILFALNRGKLNKRITTIGLLLIFSIFTILSFYLGRAEDISFLTGIDAIIYRIFDSNQMASVIGFRYVYSLDIQYGDEWLRSMLGLIPGIEGSDLSSRVFEIIFGGKRGTAPLDVWGSTYHNFGFAGCMVMGVLIGFLYTRIYIRFLRGRFNVFRICIYGAISAYLSMWIAGSPAQLFNNGLLGCMLLLLILKTFKTNETNNTRP